MNFDKNYSHYKVQDFAADELFKVWVSGHDTQINAFWKYWLLENPDKTKEVQEARELLLALYAIQPQVSDFEIEHEVQQILKKIEKQGVSKPSKLRTTFKRFSWAVAASILMTISVGLIFFLEKRTYTEGRGASAIQNETAQQPIISTEPFKVIHNNGRAAQLVLLSDGSKVTLEPKSKLHYKAHFDTDKREVILEGEAFFDVAKDPSKPFLVQAQGVMTKVLGTSFRIKAFNPNVKVIVKSGKVAVFNQNNEKLPTSEQQAIVLTPNQQAEYQSISKYFNKSVQEIPTLLIQDIKIKDLHFNDAPVVSVFNALKEAYGIEIIYDEEILHNCIITTSLTDEPLFEKLTIICKAIGATYRELDAKIIVTGRGCR